LAYKNLRIIITTNQQMLLLDLSICDYFVHISFCEFTFRFPNFAMFLWSIYGANWAIEGNTKCGEILNRAKDAIFAQGMRVNQQLLFQIRFTFKLAPSLKYAKQFVI